MQLFKKSVSFAQTTLRAKLQIVGMTARYHLARGFRIVLQHPVTTILNLRFLILEILFYLRLKRIYLPRVTDHPQGVVRVNSKDRTAYFLGVGGSGLVYIDELLEQNTGKRAKYLRYEIRLHSGPTSMIYSGHATIKHVSRTHVLPCITRRIVKAVRTGFSDLIFVYRHPLDSLLTNWICWRRIVRQEAMVNGFSEAYLTTDDLCEDLEQNFSEFKALAEGSPDFTALSPGPRFLSFREFVEETVLFLQCATLALRFEDFMIDPSREFSKILEVMSIDLNLSQLCLAPPRTKPYRYLSVKEKVPRFRNYINGLDAETKRRIEEIGYGASLS